MNRSSHQPRIEPSIAFFTMAVLYFSAALTWMLLRVTDAAILSVDLPRARWVMLHFLTIGAATQALFGSLPALSAQHAAQALKQATGSRWAQWGLLNIGWILVLIGMSGSTYGLAASGAALIIVAIFMLMVTVFGILRSSTAPAALYYRWAPLFFVIGLLMAMSMLLNWWAPGGYFGMLEAHVHANVWGFLALVAAGTLYLLIPAFSGEPLAKPRWQKPTFWLLALGAAGLVAGPWLSVHALTFGGLSLYAVGVVLLLVNLIRTFRHGERSASGHHLLWAYVWMAVPVPIAPFVLLAPDLVPAAQIEAAATTGLVYGWILQMLMGALPWIILRLRDPVSGDAGDGLFGIRERLHPVERGTPWSVALVNSGVGLLWLQALVAPTGETLETAGSIVLALGMAFFVGRPWLALSGKVSANQPIEDRSSRLGPA